MSISEIGFNTRSRRLQWTTLAGLAALLLATLAGCGESSDSESEANVQFKTSRFPTVNVLLAEYHRIAMAPIVDQESILDLYYFETTEHQSMEPVARGMTAMNTYRQALWEAFDRGARELAPLAGDENPASLVEETDARAIARQTQNDGSTLDIHLVKIGDRWWISAYTLERDPGFMDLYEDAEMVEFYTIASIAVPPIIAQIRSGAYSSEDEATEACQQAIVRTVLPDNSP